MATTTVSAGATSVSHDAMANAIRFLALDAVEKAKSGHAGLPMGAADVATVLWRDVLKFDASDPHWPDRDRFVLSAGHGCMLLYSLLYLTGVGGAKGLGIEDIKQFRQVGSRTPGHPEYWCAPGVETTTGPLGQGIATSVGMAVAERMLAARFPGIVDHHTYVIASDGDLMEGVSQESIGIAGHLKLVEADRLLGRQRDHDRRTPYARRQRRSGRPLPVGGLEREPHRRARSQGDPRRHPRGAEFRQADDDRLQDDDRLWSANPCGNPEGAQRRAGGERGRWRAQDPELALRAVCRPRRNSRRLAQGGISRFSKARSVESGGRGARPQAARRIRTTACAAICREDLDQGHRRL